MGARAAPWIAAAALVCAACASSMPEPVLRSKLREAAASVPGGDRAVVVPIHADSPMAAWTLLAEVESGDSLLARQLENRLVHAATRRSVVVVGSTHERLAREIVKDALAGEDARSLRGLTLVYVGSAEAAAALAPAAQARHARFVHRDFP